MNQEIVVSGPQIIEEFRREFTNFKTLCFRCGITDLDAVEKYEQIATRKLEALDFGQLVRTAIGCGIVKFKE